MKLNIFLLVVIAILLLILVAFKPLGIKQQKFVDVPQFTLHDFTMYELDNFGLTTLMSGKNGIKYSNRYVVKNVDYTDNSQEYIANMKAKKGVYKNQIITLTGDVKYVREDGLTFETQKVVHNRKTGIANANGPYVMYQNKNKAVGIRLVYDNIKDRIKSKNVTINYQLDEGKK
jgi:LPS export ABC transporter protein LptC